MLLVAIDEYAGFLETLHDLKLTQILEKVSFRIVRYCESHTIFHCSAVLHLFTSYVYIGLHLPPGSLDRWWSNNTKLQRNISHYTGKTVSTIT